MIRIRSAAFVFTVAVAAAALVSPSFYPKALNAQQGGTVVIEIRNYTYEFHGGILKPHEPATVVLRNKDNVTHGFNSTLLEGLDVEVESDTGTVYGHGIRGLHINPGQELKIHFMPTASGRFEFHCDLHPKMKGEILILTVGTA
jgi:plastocyanin